MNGRSFRCTSAGAPLQPARHPGVHGLARLTIVVVLGVDAHGADAIAGVRERIQARTAGNSSSSVCDVQSPVADTMSSGRGAIVAPISTLVVSSRSPGGFSQRQPPCMRSEIMLTGDRDLDPIVHRGQQKRLRSAARFSGGADRIAADVGQPLEKVH